MIYTKDKWSEDPPTEVGHYWFYGDPFMGQCGSDFEDSPLIQKDLTLVKVIQCSNSLLANNGSYDIPLRKFNNKVDKEGYLGYWKKAILPETPEWKIEI